jgi:hypothetical protein
MKTLKVSNGDIIKYNTTDGPYQTLYGRDKLVQEIKIILSTSVRKSTGLGCSLNDLIGTDTQNPASGFSLLPVAFEFQNRIKVGLQRLKDSQIKNGFLYRTSAELIKSFTTAKLFPAGDDPRNFYWSVDIFSKDYKNNVITVSGEIV